MVPAIAEETWARLLLTTLLYAILRATPHAQPRAALVAAVLLGAFTHAFAHQPATAILSADGAQMTVGALLYGVPMALLFVHRDWERAVGYHFFIDFVRFVGAL